MHELAAADRVEVLDLVDNVTAAFTDAVVPSAVRKSFRL